MGLKKSQCRDPVSKLQCITCSYFFLPVEMESWIFWEIYKYTGKQAVSEDLI